MFGSSKRPEDLALFAPIRSVRMFRKLRQVSGAVAVSFVEVATTMFGRSMKGRLAVIIVAAFVQTAAFSSSSQAGFVLTIDDPVTSGIDAIIADNMAIGAITAQGPSTHVDASGIPGVVHFFSGLAGSEWSVNITTGLSKPALLDPEDPYVVEMDLNSVNVSSTGSATLEIMLTDTDYTLPAAGPWTFQHLLGGTTNGTVTADGFIDLANLEFGLGATPGTLGPYGPDEFSGAASLPLNGSVNPFSMTQRVTIVHTAGVQFTSFDSELSATAAGSGTFTPQTVVTAAEPGTLAVFGLGLAGLGFARRKRAA